VVAAAKKKKNKKKTNTYKKVAVKRERNLPERRWMARSSSAALQGLQRVGKGVEKKRGGGRKMFENIFWNRERYSTRTTGSGGVAALPLPGNLLKDLSFLTSVGRIVKEVTRTRARARNRLPEEDDK